MKTTIEISDAIYRQVKARASLRGLSLKAYFLEALREKLEGDAKTGSSPAWMNVFGKADSETISEVQKEIDEQFSSINPGDWE